ncbi:MAG: hypothetical protein ACREQ9_02365 [Candidatus Binatia bacterium]
MNRLLVRQQSGDRRHLHAVLVGLGAPPFLDRIPDLARRFGGVGIGCDVIAYTESERRALAERADRFARTVLEGGIVLASARR